MSRLLIRSGVTPSELSSVLEDKDLSWVAAIHAGPFRAAKAIWDLREPAYWANLKTFGIKGLREQESLKLVLTTLRKSWRKSRAEAKAAVNDNNTQSPQGECIQSES